MTRVDLWPRGTRLGLAEYCANCGWRPAAHGVTVKRACGPDHPWTQHAVPGTGGIPAPCQDYKRRSFGRWLEGVLATIVGMP